MPTYPAYQPPEDNLDNKKTKPNNIIYPQFKPYFSKNLSQNISLNDKKVGYIDNNTNTDWALQNIEIDLPSQEDIDFLRNINYHYMVFSPLHTDLAVLTGNNHQREYVYLRDVDENHEYDVSYIEGLSNKYHSDVVKKDKLKNYTRYSRQFMIKPVLTFKNLEVFNRLPFQRIIKNGIKLNYTKIELGWMPQYAPDANTQYKLNEALKKEKLIKTKDTYTFDKEYVFGENQLKKGFRPIEYPVYEFNGKKYIRYKVNQCRRNNYDNVTLSNDLKYHNGEYIWIEVSKISWIVDIKRGVLISERNLLSGIQFEKYGKEFKPLDYQSSFIKKYLNDCLKHEILRNEYFKKKNDDKVKEEKTTNKDNTNSNQITSLLNRIAEYKKYYLGTVNIEDKVKNLLINYNKSLDNLANNNFELSIETKDPRLLYQRLILDLEEILMELKVHGEKVKNYHDMIDILIECKKNNIDTSKDELCQIINTIKSVIIEFISDTKVKEELKKELNDIITQNIKRNRSYIDEFKTNDNKQTKPLEILKLEFRKDLQDFLETKIVSVIEKQDIVNEIMNNVKLMVDNHFTESKNKLVSNYLRILNDIISRIKTIGSEEDKEKLKKIINLDFDISDDISIIMRKLESMIIEAYKIQLDIEETYVKNKEIDDLRVNVNLSNIFNNKRK